MDALLDRAEVPRKHRARLREHVLAQLCCLGEHTLTGLLSVCGRQFDDWSADYRLYSKNRVQPQALFDVVRKQLCAQPGPLVAAMDDTCLPKTGTKIHGVKYMRDPMGPPFQTNLIRGQRFVQISLALVGGDGSARMLPADWWHAPRPKKPGQKASAEELAGYKAESEKARLSQVGAERILALRRWMDEHGAAGKLLWVVVDSSYTNRTVLTQLPENTVLAGRIRGDAKLNFLPSSQAPLGRHRVYGEQAPTPRELEKDPRYPWQDLRVHIGGKKRRVRAKRLGPLRWRAATGKQDLQMIVIAPTPYRSSKNGKLQYRQPAYLICTDPDASLQEIVQHYLWRWDIEGNFREQKSLLGIGQARVRTPNSVQNLSGSAVAAYALLLLAAENCKRNGKHPRELPPPKWRPKAPRRNSTASLIQTLRHELWADAIHFSHFAKTKAQDTKPEKCNPPLASAVFYANNHT